MDGINSYSTSLGQGQIGGIGGASCLVERFIRRRAMRAMASLTRVAAIPRLLAAQLPLTTTRPGAVDKAILLTDIGCMLLQVSVPCLRQSDRICSSFSNSCQTQTGRHYVYGNDRGWRQEAQPAFVTRLLPPSPSDASRARSTGWDGKRAKLLHKRQRKAADLCGSQ